MHRLRLAGESEYRWVDALANLGVENQSQLAHSTIASPPLFPNPWLWRLHNKLVVSAMITG